jgi:hypothetical protein
MQILLRRLQAPAENRSLAENKSLTDGSPETAIRLKAELRVRDSTAAPASVLEVRKENATVEISY